MLTFQAQGILRRVKTQAPALLPSFPSRKEERDKCDRVDSEREVIKAVGDEERMQELDRVQA